MDVFLSICGVIVGLSVHGHSIDHIRCADYHQTEIQDRGIVQNGIALGVGYGDLSTCNAVAGFQRQDTLGIRREALRTDLKSFAKQIP